MEISTRRFNFSFSASLPRVSFSRRDAGVLRGHVRPAPVVQEAASTDVVLDPTVIARRVAVLRNLFPYLFGWLGSRAELAAMHQVNDYLSQASNLTELEQRIRHVEQRRGAVGLYNKT